MSDVPTAAEGDPRTEIEGDHDLSLLLGGPFYQLLLRGRAIRPTFDLLVRRILVLSLVPWLPLLLLTLAAGTTIGSGIAVPFLLDVEVHARFLVAIPLLVLAERTTHRRLRPIFDRFVERDLVAPEDLARFDAILAGARRWRNSYAAEAVMIAASFGLTWLWRHHVVLEVPTWYGSRHEGSLDLTPAGAWYGFAALPIMRFLFLRWLYRLALLYVVFARIARLPLRIVPTHPDRVGGLGFLGEMGTALQPFLMAITALVSGFIANQVIHGGNRLADYYVHGGVVLAFLLLLTLLPLVFFASPLAVARRRGLRDYRARAHRYVDAFGQKWVRPVPADGEPLLGSADIQSLADLSTAYDLVREMQTIPVGLRPTIRLLVTSAIPLAPLLLLQFPLTTILEGAFKLLL